MARYRLFVGCSFLEERTNLRNYIREQVELQGTFTPVLGGDIDPIAGPAQKVRSLMKSCNAAMIVETADRNGTATPWIYSEIGMAYQEHLPIFALVDQGSPPFGCCRFVFAHKGSPIPVQSAGYGYRAQAEHQR